MCPDALLSAASAFACISISILVLQATLRLQWVAACVDDVDLEAAMASVGAKRKKKRRGAARVAVPVSVRARRPFVSILYLRRGRLNLLRDSSCCFCARRAHPNAGLTPACAFDFNSIMSFSFFSDIWKIIRNETVRCEQSQFTVILAGEDADYNNDYDDFARW